MSVACPKCGTELNQDFGLITCSKCTSVVSVDVDGNATLASEDFHTQTQAQPEPPPQMDTPAPVQENSYQKMPEQSYQQIPEPPPPTEMPQQDYSIPQEQNYAQPAEMASVDQAAIQPPAELPPYDYSAQQTPEPAVDQSYAQSEPAAATPPPETPVEFFNDPEPAKQEPEPEITKTWAAPKNPIQEIRDFGNKESVSGPLTYSVIIEKIDIGERLKEVFEALSDSKFGWDESSLKKNYRGGTLQLDNLNPAQAVMVVRKLRGINVQITWTQSLYS